MKRPWQCLLIAFVVVPVQTSSSGQGTTPLPTETTQRIDAIFATWDKTNSPGCAIGASQNGKVVYTRGFGMSNLEYDVPITPDSIFSIGSISKQFTAFSIALLASQGKLSLDDDVRRYLPQVPGYGQRITIRHLLTHTSGLRDAWDLLFLVGWRSGDVITQDDVLRMVARQKAPDFAPGSEYFYNNAGYVLLAEIVKVVSGQSQRAFAETQIFGPLGMRDTSINEDRTMIVRNRAAGYRPKIGSGWTNWFPVTEVLGADGVFTTVGDLLKWEENFVDARVGGRGLLDEMATSGRLNDGSTTSYGFGLQVDTYRGVRTFGHGGTAGGYVANVVRFPDQHLAIAALCNLRTINPRNLTRRVADILLGSGVLAPPPAPAPSVSVGEAELAALPGTYWNPIVGLRRFVVQDGRLMMDGVGLLTPIGGGRFRGAPNELLFPPARVGAPQELHILMPARTVVLSLVTAPSYSATDLKAFTGEYRSDELDASFTITALPEGHLAVVRRRSDPIPLTALKADTFFSEFSDGAGTVTFARAPSGDVTGFVITGGTPRRVVFTRSGPTSLAGK